MRFWKTIFWPIHRFSYHHKYIISWIHIISYCNRTFFLACCMKTIRHQLALSHCNVRPTLWDLKRFSWSQSRLGSDAANHLHKLLLWQATNLALIMIATCQLQHQSIKVCKKDFLNPFLYLISCGIFLLIFLLKVFLATSELISVTFIFRLNKQFASLLKVSKGSHQ